MVEGDLPKHPLHGTHQDGTVLVVGRQCGEVVPPPLHPRRHHVSLGLGLRRQTELAAPEAHPGRHGVLLRDAPTEGHPGAVGEVEEDGAAGGDVVPAAKVDLVVVSVVNLDPTLDRLPRRVSIGQDDRIFESDISALHTS